MKRAKKKRHKRKRPLPQGKSHTLVVDHPPGMEDLARRELRHLGRDRLKILDETNPAETGFIYHGSPAFLLRLRLSAALYQVHHFQVPRPKAFLGHEHWQRILGYVAGLRGRFPAGTFQTFRIAAAGRHSTVFKRIRETLEQDTGLQYDEAEADLQIRVRPAKLHDGGWEWLLRLSPRPLTSRSWRLFNYQGAINGVVAAAMIEMSRPRRDERVLNLMCGSGTLLIERALRSRAGLLVGSDLNGEALLGAKQNVAAAHLDQAVYLVQEDALHPAHPAGRFDTILIDPPWGQLVGEQEDPKQLYPTLLQECNRLVKPGGQLLIITHQLRLWEETAATKAGLWELQSSRQIFQGGLHPRIYHYRNLK